MQRNSGSHGNLDLPGMIKNVVDFDSKPVSPKDADGKIVEVTRVNYNNENTPLATESDAGTNT